MVERVLGGERRAFDDLVRRYQRQAVAVSYRLLGNSHDALDHYRAARILLEVRAPSGR